MLAEVNWNDLVNNIILGFVICAFFWSIKDNKCDSCNKKEK